MNSNSDGIIVAMKHVLWVIDKKFSIDTIKLRGSSLTCAISNMRQNSCSVVASYYPDEETKQVPSGPLVVIKQSEISFVL